MYISSGVSWEWYGIVWRTTKSTIFSVDLTRWHGIFHGTWWHVFQVYPYIPYVSPWGWLKGTCLPRPSFSLAFLSKIGLSALLIWRSVPFTWNPKTSEIWHDFLRILEDSWGIIGGSDTENNLPVNCQVVNFWAIDKSWWQLSIPTIKHCQTCWNGSFTIVRFTPPSFIFGTIYGHS